MIEISEELKNLAQIFKKHSVPLYIVGGYVRESLTKVKNELSEDIDLCSFVTPDKLEKILKGTDFKVEELNKKLGVMEIVGEEKRYEHSTFRREIFSNNSNFPTSIEFIKTLKEDAERRDFKINAIYYDIINNKYIDPFAGVRDIKNNTIKTVKTPRLVLQDDPERILRLIRFANVLGFSIGEEELEIAKANAYKVQGLSKKRVRNEFNKLMLSDKYYPTLKNSKSAHINALKMLDDFNILQYIFPSLAEIKSASEMTDNMKQLFNKIIKHLGMVDVNLRIPIIFIDILNNKKSLGEKDFDEKEFVKNLVEKNLGSENLNYPADVLSKVKNIVLGYSFQKKFLMSKKDIRRFVFYHYNAMTEILALKKLFPINENETEKEKLKRLEFIELISQTYNEMKNENVIFDKEKLDIKGEEIINRFPKIKLELLEEFKLDIAAKLAETTSENNKENLLDAADKVMNSKQDYYCEKW
ncbi:MAG: CCA tRNA nucleotidyltransferase [Clostridia bacterium]|nr:CCA tRNA nucleotidyltransferase [Clostridia bacterium]